MNELDIVSKYLPLEENFSKYLLIKTKVNYFNDLTFRVAIGLDNMVRKFDVFHYDMKPMIVGIKCYTEDTGYVYVNHYDRNKKSNIIIDDFTMENEKWYTFKYPLVDNYHTETYLNLSGVSAYTLAIMNCPQRARHDLYSNSIDGKYKSLFSSIYSSCNKPIIYFDKDFVNPFNFDFNNSVIIPTTKSLMTNGYNIDNYVLKEKKE